MSAALSDELWNVAERLARLSIHHRDPERFFVERDELRATLARLARDAAMRERVRQ